MNIGIEPNLPVFRPTGAAFWKRLSTNYTATAPTGSPASYPSDFYCDPNATQTGDSTKTKAVQDGRGNAYSSSTYYHDGSTTTSTGPSKGNLTERDDLDNSVSPARTAATKWTYSSSGNISTNTDPDGNETYYTYGPQCGVSDLYPTLVTKPLNESWSYTYDCPTGRPISETDPNSIQSAFHYDTVGRLLSLIKGGILLNTFVYVDPTPSSSSRFLVSQSTVDSSHSTVKVSWFDPLNRLAGTQELEYAVANPITSAQVSAIAQSNGGAISSGSAILTQHQYQYSTSTNPGYYEYATNPYRSTSDSGYGWTRTWHDRNGRVTEVARFGGTNRRRRDAECCRAG